jgi:hypothetical protein
MIEKQLVHFHVGLCTVSTYSTFAIKIRPILSDGSYFYPVMRDSKDSMQQSGGLLLMPGSTGMTP